MINGYKTRREWKIQLTMRISFICFKDSKEACTMYTKSRNIEIIMGNETDDITEELRKSRLQEATLLLTVLIYYITTFKK